MLSSVIDSVNCGKYVLIWNKSENALLLLLTSPWSISSKLLNNLCNKVEVAFSSLLVKSLVPLLYDIFSVMLYIRSDI